MNLKDVKSFIFPAGEIHPTIDLVDTGYIYASIASSDDLIKLLLVTDAYKRKFNITPELYLPYIPYARQDRVCNNGEALSIKVLADLINSQNYPKVYVLDPHSDVSTALINNVNVTDSTVLAKKVWVDLQNKYDLTVIAPDAGALKKTNKITKAVGYDKDVVFCEKIRNTKTGEITGTKVYCDDIYNQSFIIFDDICDGGRTFIEIAKVLKEKGANKVILVVSHGIFSKGFKVMFEYIDKIYCTDSFSTDFNNIDKNGYKFNIYSALELMQGYDEKQLQKDIRRAI